ncbi:MAG: metallophosphoesterase family protein [Acidimicrobiales bacterium]
MKALRGVSRSAAQSLWRTHQEIRGPSAFLGKNFLPWLWNYLKVVGTPRWKFPGYRAAAADHPGCFTIPDSCVIGLASDWGTGTESAYRVSDAIATLRPDITIHLGDVYYSGTLEEYRTYFLGEGDWPRGRLRTHALNANHEMYSGGEGYFGAALPALGQETSYFCLENAHWRIVALDTGYYAKSVPFLELVVNFIRLHRDTRRWLADVVFADARDRRPVILLSHHQWFSAFDSEYKRIGAELAPYLDRVLLWFWGHEHRLAGYASFGFGGATVRARCIGHGGMPIEIGKAPQRSDRPLVFTDERQAGSVDGEPIGYCGYVVLRLDGPALVVQYVDEMRNTLLEERWSVDAGGVRGAVALGGQLKTVRPLSDLVSS